MAATRFTSEEQLLSKVQYQYAIYELSCWGYCQYFFEQNETAGLSLKLDKRININDVKLSLHEKEGDNSLLR